MAQMAMRGAIKYRYASTDSRQVVDVFELDANDPFLRKVTYTCVACGDELVAALGPKNQRHFRHKFERDCSKETYLHNTAKWLFYQAYSACLASGTSYSVIVTPPKKCTHCHERLGVCCDYLGDAECRDLTERYRSIAIEQPDGDFIPDIALIDAAGAPLYIEIAVTHLASGSKRTSGRPIIEIKIQSEEDLALISQRSLSAEDPRVEFVNFPSPEPGDRSADCDRAVCLFLVDHNGIASIVRGQGTELCSSVDAREYQVHLGIPDNCDSTLWDSIARAVQTGARISSCWLCRHHQINVLNDFDENPVYCTVDRTIGKHDRALACPNYTPDSAVRYLGANGKTDAPTSLGCSRFQAVGEGYRKALLFYQVYDGCLASQLPFNLIMRQFQVCPHCKKQLDLACDLQELAVTHDLTKYFTRLEFGELGGQGQGRVILRRAKGEEMVQVAFVADTAYSRQQQTTDCRMIFVWASYSGAGDMIRERKLVEGLAACRRVPTVRQAEV
jgi:hypothetical protein